VVLLRLHRNDVNVLAFFLQESRGAGYRASGSAIRQEMSHYAVCLILERPKGVMPF